MVVYTYIPTCNIHLLVKVPTMYHWLSDVADLLNGVSLNKQTSEAMAEELRDDNHMSVAEAKEFGIIDSIGSPFSKRKPSGGKESDDAEKPKTTATKSSVGTK